LFDIHFFKILDKENLLRTHQYQKKGFEREHHKNQKHQSGETLIVLVHILIELIPQWRVLLFLKSGIPEFVEVVVLCGSLGTLPNTRQKKPTNQLDLLTRMLSC